MPTKSAAWASFKNAGASASSVQRRDSEFEEGWLTGTFDFIFPATNNHPTPASANGAGLPLSGGWVETNLDPTNVTICPLF